MTCSQCERLRSASFSSESRFENHLAKLKEMIGDGVIAKISQEKRVDDCFAEDHVRCTECNMEWVVSHPDQSYRGYSLPLDEAKEKNSNK